MKKTTVGIIGCGAIAGIYTYNCYRLHNLQLLALSDLDPARAHARLDDIKSRYTSEWKLPQDTQLPTVCTPEQLLANPDIDLVLNLTVPKAHAPVALQALAAGKHTYHEKPFALSREEGQQILALAQQKNLRVGCAPDTFLGAGLQTCRKLIDDGWIGEPIGATAFMTCPGHESWHPDPEFYYQKGGGPLFDMGPYYLTALVHLIGPVKSVAAHARATYRTRTITSPKKYGSLIPVETPTHIASTLEFTNGAIANMLMSFDVFGANLPRIEIYGTQGSLSIPDPNTFGTAGGGGGDIKVKVGRNDWAPIPYTHPYKSDFRGLGAADLAAAIQSNRPHRASAQLGYHVLDIMQSTLEAAQQSRTLPIASTTPRPHPLPLGLREGELD